jgi:hypothetical protein
MNEAGMITLAINRLAAAIERLAEVYLEVNVKEEDREPRDGQSLSDVG